MIINIILVNLSPMHCDLMFINNHYWLDMIIVVIIIVFHIVIIIIIVIIFHIVVNIMNILVIYYKNYFIFLINAVIYNEIFIVINKYEQDDLVVDFYIPE